MRILVNSEHRETTDGATVADLVGTLGRRPDRPGAAVAVNGEVVPRSQWPERILRDGDRVEVLAAAQGG